MATYTTRTTSKTWHEVVQPVPALRADLYKALHQVETDYERAYGKKADTDDAFEVLAGNDEIVIRFEIKEKN